MELGKMVLDQYQSELTTIEADFQKAKRAGANLIKADIKDDRERRRALQVLAITESAEQKAGLPGGPRGGARRR